MTTDGYDKPAYDAESAERWVSGKSEDELLSDLKVYSARLRDDPRNVHDRLRVAAIQLRLGRVAEALVHYEGVLRAYVGQDQVMSAIALCRRIITIYPDMPRLQRILAALYARAPREEFAGISPVTPLPEPTDTGFYLENEPAEAPTQQRVARLFHTSSGLHPAVSRDLLDERDLQPGDYGPQGEPGAPIPLVQRKGSDSKPAPSEPPPRSPGGVTLLTRRKP